MTDTWVAQALRRNHLTHREVAKRLNKPTWYVTEACKTTKNLSIVEIYNLSEAVGVGFIYACIQAEKEVIDGDT